MAMKMSILRSGIVSAVLLVLVLTSSGCSPTSRRVFLDEPTPQGSIESRQPTTAGDEGKPYRPYGADPEASLDATAEHRSATQNPAFQEAYESAGRPRIAVFVNRELPQKLREWESDHRLRVDRVGTYISHEGSTIRKGTEFDTFLIAMETKPGRDEVRPTDDTWLWQLEDAILQPLQTNRVRVVHSAMIVRLAALEQEGTMQESMPVKLLETRALRDHADVLVEVLIGGEKNHPVFRVRATDTREGLVLSSFNTEGWEKDPLSRNWTATNAGYAPEELPRPDVLGSGLAKELMGRLEALWHAGPCEKIGDVRD